MSLVDHWMGKYTEETAILTVSGYRSSGLQMAEMSSIYSSTGQVYEEVTPVPSMGAATVQESSVLAVGSPVDDYLDGVGTGGRIIDYVVQENDLISFIASDYGVSVDSIVWANNLRSADSIIPGQILKIPPVSGVLHTVAAGDTVLTLARKYAVEADQIIAYNKLPADGALQMGDELVIPDGRKAVVATAISGAGTVQFSHLPDLGDFFFTPTVGVINRGRGIHSRNGMDIANTCGTQVYAAADGVAKAARTTSSTALSANGGYGNYIVITHPNGTETLYAHLLANSIKIDALEPVAKGQVIAQIGGRPYTPGAGNSTGCHLHFEVHGAKNPLTE